MECGVWQHQQAERGAFAETEQSAAERQLRPQGLRALALLCADCDICLTNQICDFGLARVAQPHADNKDVLTEYVATRSVRLSSACFLVLIYLM